MSAPNHSHRPAPAWIEEPAGDDHPEYDGPSKSQRKRDMLALQKLGERLLTLSDAKLAALELPDTLRDALKLARRITAHEGRRRQLQYIGKLMRGVDADAIRAAIDIDDSAHRAEVALMHRAEHWRERLLSSPESLGEWLNQYPAAATLGLHTLIRAARREVERSQPGRHYRELYRVLRTAMTPPGSAKTADLDPETKQDL